MSLKRINHGNENHTPGFVEDTGDVMTGNLDINGVTVGLIASHDRIQATTARLYIGGSAADVVLIGYDSGSTALTAIGNNGVIYPIQAPTVSAPTYVEGGLYYDTTLHKLMIGGAAGWETVTSS